MNRQEVIDFLSNIQHMREAQKVYFKYRRPSDLKHAKWFEHRVDTFLSLHARRPVDEIVDELAQLRLFELDQ